MYDSRSSNHVGNHPHHRANDSVRRIFSADIFDEQEQWIHGQPAAPEFLPRRARPCWCHRDSLADLPNTRGRAVLPSPLLWAVRIGVPLAAILISAGFFFSVLPPTATKASGAVSLIYFGAAVLAFSVVTLGIGLLRQPA